MPRGRHRHASPVRRLLPPMAGAVLASACAGSAWLSDDPVVLRVMVAAAATAACTGAVLLRKWDRAADKEIARLRRARLRDEWHADEKIAELESDLDEFREIRSRVERQLGAKRSELNRLRNEHAALLRRYATAESERAAALENVRLALDAVPEPSQLTPTLFLKAANVLRSLEESAEREAEPDAEGERPAPDEPHERTSAAEEPHQVRGHAGLGAAGVAVAVVPMSRQVTPRSAGAEQEDAFDFFGAQKENGQQGNKRDDKQDEDDEDKDSKQHGEHAPELPAPAVVPELTSGADLADVVGEELLENKARDEDGRGDAVDVADPEVIDLTVHDETESIDVRHLRALP